MDRETLNYIANRMRDRRSEEERRMAMERSNRRMEDDRSTNRYNERSNKEEHPISSRYGYTTNTYRAEGTIEGRIEHEPHKKEQEIGFRRGGRKGDQEFLYELEEAFEDKIDCILYYSELAMEAHEKGHVEFADAFYNIAETELSCAEKLRHRLITHGEYDPSKQSEIEDRFDKAKHLFRRL